MMTSSATGGVANMIIGVTSPLTENPMKKEPPERLKRTGLKRSVMKEERGRSATILRREATIPIKENPMMTEEKVIWLRIQASESDMVRSIPLQLLKRLLPPSRLTFLLALPLLGKQIFKQ